MYFILYKITGSVEGQNVSQKPWFSQGTESPTVDQHNTLKDLGHLGAPPSIVRGASNWGWGTRRARPTPCHSTKTQLREGWMKSFLAWNGAIYFYNFIHTHILCVIHQVTIHTEWVFAGYQSVLPLFVWNRIAISRSTSTIDRFYGQK